MLYLKFYKNKKFENFCFNSKNISNYKDGVKKKLQFNKKEEKLRMYQY
jgi:hypothetical protein